MIKKIVGICWVLVLLQGCTPNALNFKIQYQRINGLKPEQSVIYESNPIGHITTIELAKEGHYLVSVLINPDFTNTVTVGSEFFIVQDPNLPAQKAIEVVSASSEHNEALEDGVVVKGMEVTTQTDVLMKGLTQGLTEGLGGLKEQLDLFSGQIKRLPESKEFKQLERELNRFGKEMGKAGKQIQDRMSKEIIPGLQKELDKLEQQFSQPSPTQQKTKPGAVDA